MRAHRSILSRSSPLLTIGIKRAWRRGTKHLDLHETVVNFIITNTVEYRDEATRRRILMAALTKPLDPFGTRAPAWIMRQLESRALRVVDVRAARSFARGHVPGAVHLDVRATLFDHRGAVVSVGEVALAMSTLGVGDEHTVVLVDDDARGDVALAAARVLARYGHRDVHLLDGGFARWLAESRPVSRAATRYPAASFTARAAHFHAEASVATAEKSIRARS
jgi:3-mercaptopyruvate sulfurtransferase SseA